MLHVMRWMKRLADLRPERAWLISLSGQIRCLRSEFVPLVLILAVCGLFVLSLQCCNSNISSSALRQGLRRENIRLSWWSGTSQIDLSCQSYWFSVFVDFNLKENHLLWHYFFAQRQSVNSFMQVDKARVDCYPNQGRQRFMRFYESSVYQLLRSSESI